MTKELTGRHVLFIVLTAFAVIIAANMTMLFAATGSFPGLVVKNSYVAGQGWDARADAQRQLGWTAEVTYKDRALQIALIDHSGSPVVAAPPKITVGRPTTSATDHISLPVKAGLYEVPITLAPGRWRVDVVTQDPERFETMAEVWIAED